MQDRKGFFALLLNGIVLGTYGVWVRFLQNSFTASQQVIGRSLISLIGALMLVFLLKANWHFQKKYNNHLIFYLFSFAISTLLFTIAVVKTSIALSVFSLYIGSIITAFIMGVFMFGEKIDTRKIISILFVLLALLSFILPYGFQFINIGFVVGIFSGVFDGIGNGFKKYFAGKIERPVLIVYQLLSTLLVALAVSVCAHETFVIAAITLPSTTVMLIYGALFLAVAYLSMYGFQHFNLNLGTIVISTELFWAPFFAFLVFRETLTHYQVLGGVLLALAILIPYIRIHKATKYLPLKRLRY